MSFSQPVSTQNFQSPFWWALGISVLVHAVGVFFMSHHFVAPKEAAPEVLRVQLVQQKTPGQRRPKPVVAPKVAPQTPIKNQVSVAPPEPPKKAEPKKEPPKVAPPKPEAPKVDVKKEKPAVKEEAKKKVEAEEAPKQKPKTEKRPPKLDKTPDKKEAIKSNDKKAKTKAPETSFLDTLDFIDTLQPQPIIAPKPVAKPTPQPMRETAADQRAKATVQKHITKNWHFNSDIYERQNLSVVVRVEVDPTGRVLNIQTVQPSTMPAFDSSLLRAIRRASPLPIPLDRYELFRTIELRFQS